jgi:PIN domain nuclease of toxin-antitoxin system
VEGDARRVGRRARQLLSRSESREAIRISPASVFEVAALHAAGRIRLASPLEHWFREALAAAGVRIAELSPAIALDAGAIPSPALADPLDRLLVATARALQATLLTSDTRILVYAATTGNVRAQNASE